MVLESAISESAIPFNHEFLQGYEMMPYADCVAKAEL